MGLEKSTKGKMSDIDIFNIDSNVRCVYLSCKSFSCCLLLASGCMNASSNSKLCFGFSLSESHMPAGITKCKIDKNSSQSDTKLINFFFHLKPNMFYPHHLHVPAGQRAAAPAAGRSSYQGCVGLCLFAIVLLAALDFLWLLK